MKVLVGAFSGQCEISRRLVYSSNEDVTSFTEVTPGLTPSTTLTNGELLSECECEDTEAADTGLEVAAEVAEAQPLVRHTDV